MHPNQIQRKSFVPKYLIIYFSKRINELLQTSPHRKHGSTPIGMKRFPNWSPDANPPIPYHQNRVDHSATPTKCNLDIGELVRTRHPMPMLQCLRADFQVEFQCIH